MQACVHVFMALLSCRLQADSDEAANSWFGNSTQGARLLRLQAATRHEFKPSRLNELQKKQSCFRMALTSLPFRGKGGGSAPEV